MKKNLVRVLLLCVVLAFVVGTALADTGVTSVTIESNKTGTLYLGDTATITATLETCEHTWDEGTVTKEATCGAEGEKTKTCTKCQEKKKEVIPATGAHNVAEDGWVQNPESGKLEGTCTVCGQKVIKDAAATDSADKSLVSDSTQSLVTLGVNLFTNEGASNTDTSTITWQVSGDPGVIELSSTTGASVTATAKKAGTATVTASCGGKESNSITFTVSAAKIICDGTDIELGKSDSLRPDISGLPADHQVKYSFESN